MKFIADLHIHSRFSRATAKTLNFESLYIAARLKGITVVGTGDFTHPGWFSEIREMLVPAEPGLFRLKEELEEKCEQQIRLEKTAPVRFMLSCEISNIYKKAGRTRKIHNLVFLPDLESAARFNARLDTIGNIKSDGRPILGLDSRDLLEILMETDDEGFLIPAHIWTPWFSMFGSKSGFDSIEECFDDLTPHIFALETGLSSDPPMNWRVGDIDGLTLVSNSDAHSPANLGREANLFDTDLSYPAIKSALKTGDLKLFCGTLEFYPQEGKYHQDGHRKCGINLTPKEAARYNRICPVCGQPLTLGVLHRVEDLATREEGEKPEKTHPYYSIIPLAEMIGEIVRTGSKSKKVGGLYKSAIETIGPELEILHATPIETIKKAGIPLLGEAVKRMREGRVHISPGYDGEYGRITLFSQDEMDGLSGQRTLFQVEVPDTSEKKQGKETGQLTAKKEKEPGRRLESKKHAQGRENGTRDGFADTFAGLNDDQIRAVTHEAGPLLIVAGPGTGKTRTLTCRIAYLIKNRGVDPHNILAVTFTNKAATEMIERLRRMLGPEAHLPQTTTFHSFCFNLLKQLDPNEKYTVIDDYDRRGLIKEAIRRLGHDGIRVRESPDAVLDRIVAAKQHILSPVDDLSPVADGFQAKDLKAVYGAYQQMLKAQHLYDYEDLILKTVQILETDKSVQQRCRDRYRYIFIDEYQDLNHGQYRIIRAMTSPESDVFAIGDPNQSIYGFRGSDVSYFKRFATDFPNAVQISLTKNYRSAETVLSAAHQVIRRHALNSSSVRIYSGLDGPSHISILEAETEKAEAVQIGKIIEEMVGGTGFYFDDFDKNRNALHGSYRAFSDFAVLYRTRAQGRIIAETFTKAGIPCQIANKESLFGLRGVLELISFLKIINGYGAYPDFERINAILENGLKPEEMEAVKAWGYEDGCSFDSLMAGAEGPSPVLMNDSGMQRLNNILKRFAGHTEKSSGLSVKEKLIYLSKQPEIQNIIGSDAKIREALDRVIGISEAFGEDTAGFLESAALQADPDIFETGSQKVALMTLHAAKGLEFPVVFIAGCENGFIPFVRAGRSPSDPDEERRLFYVAMTRAKDHLFFTWAKRRTIFGKAEKRRISPYLSDIEDRLLKQEERQQLKKKKPAQVQLKLF